jgi:hypothetical protein
MRIQIRLEGKIEVICRDAADTERAGGEEVLRQLVFSAQSN